MIKIDSDGYIRLRPDVLRGIPLVHLASGLDEEEHDGAAGAAVSAIRGYTEWASASTPAISMGWDWRMETLVRPIRVVREESPRSNIMLVDELGNDIGPDKTASHLETLVETLDWKPIVIAAVGIRTT